MKVSVIVVTYNQEAYLPQALDSILAQQCDFDFEIIVGEDCSTDNTRKVCLSYQAKYPDKIRLLLHEKNQGLVENFFQLLEICRGEYIAKVDGDDYWCNPLKLQQQVAFLDQHPDYAMVDGGVRIYDEATSTFADLPLEQWPQDDLFGAIIRGKLGVWSCPSATCFRHSMYKKIDTLEIRRQKFLTEELALYLGLAHEGKFFTIPEMMAVYRKSAEGSVSRSRQVEKRMRLKKSYNDIAIFFARKYNYGGPAFIRRLKNNLHDTILKYLIGSGKYTEAQAYIHTIPGAECWRWKVCRSWLALKLPFLRRVLFGKRYAWPVE